MAIQHTSPRVIEPDAIGPDAGDGAPSGASSVTEQFDLTFRGFDRGQVEAYLDHWGHQFWAMERERDAALLELEELRANPPVQLSPLSTMSLRLQQIITAAEEEAALLRADAADEAQRIRDAALDEAEEERSAAAAERSVATGDAQRIRTEAQEIYEQASSAARALTLRTQAEAQQRVADAAAEGDSLLAEAAEEAARLRAEAVEEREAILAESRHEAAELARATAHRREIAQAEHQRLLEANEAVQEKRTEQLREVIADLQRELEHLTVTVERRRPEPAAPAPTRPTPYGGLTEPAGDATAVHPLPTTADDDTGEQVSFTDLFHTGGTGDALAGAHALFREAGIEPHDDADDVLSGEGRRDEGPGDAVPSD